MSFMFRSKNLVGLAAFFGAAALTLASCSSEDNGETSPPPRPSAGSQSSSVAEPANEPLPSPKVIATARGAAPNLSGVTVAVTSLRRDSVDIVTLVVTITNGGSEPMSYLRLDSSSGNYRSPSASAVTLIDPDAKLRYYPLRDTDKVCVCTPFLLGDGLPVGARTDATVSFPAPPAGVDSLTVDWPGFTPASGVPLS